MIAGFKEAKENRMKVAQFEVNPLVGLVTNREGLSRKNTLALRGEDSEPEDTYEPLSAPFYQLDEDPTWEAVAAQIDTISKEDAEVLCH